MTKFYFTSQPIDRIPAELVILLHFEDDIPLHGMLGLIDWRINGRLSHLLKENRFAGLAREKLLMPAEHRFKAEKLVIMGLGKRDEFHDDFIAQIIDFIFDTVREMKSMQICVSFAKLNPSQFAWRNAIRLFVTKLVDFQDLKEVIFCEPEDLVQEAKRRQLDFGANVQVEFL